MAITLTTVVMLIAVGCTEPLTDFSCSANPDCMEGYYCDLQDSFRCIEPQNLSCTENNHCPPEPWVCNQGTGFCVSHKPDGGLDGEDDGGDIGPDGDELPDGGDIEPDGGDELPDAGDEDMDGGDIEPDAGDEDPCAGIDCGNHGSCVSGSCYCHTGYTGDVCDECDTDYQDNDGNNTCLPDCTISDLTCDAEGGGHCEDDSGTAVCICDAGYHEDDGTCVSDFPFPSRFTFTLGSPPIGFTESKSNIIEWSQTAVGGPAAQRRKVFRLNYDQGQVTDVFLVRDGTDITSNQEAKINFAHFSDDGEYDLVAIAFIVEDDYTTNQTKYYTLQATSTGTTVGEWLDVTLLSDEVLTGSLDGDYGSFYDAVDTLLTTADGACGFDPPWYIWSPRSEPGGHIPAVIDYGNCNATLGSGTPDYADGFWLRDEMAGITVTIPRL